MPVYYLVFVIRLSEHNYIYLVKAIYNLVNSQYFSEAYSLVHNS